MQMEKNRYEKSVIEIMFFNADDVLADSDPNELPMVPLDDWTAD